jgi:nicotinate-nucleotide adenylyltransferase
MIGHNNILMFGGTFDPIHYGHLRIARAAADQLGVDKIILIPSANPPHKTLAPVTDFHHRLAMARLAVEGEPDGGRWRICDCEAARPGPSYTLDTVGHIKKQLAPDVCYWLIGGDTVRELPTWYKISSLADACVMATALRPGSERPDFDSLRTVLNSRQIDILKNHVLTTPLIDISSTEIRRRVAADEPLTGLVPPAVERYIADHNLYHSS